MAATMPQSILDAYRKDNYDNATLKYDFTAEGQAIANMFESNTDTVNAYNATLTADGDYANGRGNGWMPTDQPAEYRLGEMFTNDEGIFRVEGLALWAVSCRRNHHPQGCVPVRSVHRDSGRQQPAEPIYGSRGQRHHPPATII